MADTHSLSFIPLGVGDAFSARWYSSCLAVEHHGRWLLIDCPHPIRKMMREAGEEAGTPLDVASIDAIVLTHLHADHCSGLEGFGYFSHFVLRRRAHLVAHPDVVGRLWSGCLAAGMEQLIDAREHRPHAMQCDDYFEHTPLDTTRVVRVGPFEVASRMTTHHIPTTALRVRAGGRTLGYSADTAWDPGLIDWLSDADLIVHETNYGAHTPYARLAALPAELRARMRLIHYADDFALGDSAIEPLIQGRRYTVGAPDGRPP